MPTVTLSTAEALEAFAEDFAKRLEPGAVIILSGPMGAGKTTFTKGLARGLGSSVLVSSPTYTYAHEYPTQTGVLVHIDAYRLESPRKLWAMGLQDWITTAQAVVIEWGEALQEELPEAQLIRFEIDLDRRRLSFPEPQNT
jgi:tRNA threonylcarbamoyladenosine biosynthesis protein TsaE